MIVWTFVVTAVVSSLLFFWVLSPHLWPLFAVPLSACSCLCFRWILRTQNQPQNLSHCQLSKRPGIGLSADDGGICVFMRFGVETRLVVMILLFVII